MATVVVPHEMFQNENTNRCTLRNARWMLIFGLSVILSTLCAWRFHKSYFRKQEWYTFNLKLHPTPIHDTGDRFLSFGLDSSLLRDMNNFPITDERFVNLARHLSPAYVRVGGTSADCLYFNQTTVQGLKKISPVDGQDISNFSITTENFEDLYNFAKKSHSQMLFDLNALIRNQDNTWNNTNARDIISFAKDRYMDLDWQLGNEPNSFHHVFNVTITAAQLGRDYHNLRQLLNEYGFTNNLLVGPEVNHVGDDDHKGELYAKEFIDSSQNSVDYITWHQYYLNGRIADVVDFINPKTFNYLQMQIESMKKFIGLTKKHMSMWLSETSTAYGGGAPELSDRFVAGFLWLDKLGYSAMMGLKVVIRQSLFGGNYAMVGPDLLPNPDWWLSVIYKQLVSNKVFKIQSPNHFGSVRLYAHCTPKRKQVDGVPALTVYGMNLNSYPVKVNIQGLIPILQRGWEISFFALTSDDLKSREVRLNGHTLRLNSNGDLPPFKPIILRPSRVVTLPTYSMVFMVIHGVNIQACAS